MTLRLPVVSGQELVAAPGKIGYRVVRQKGSHVRLRHTEPSRKPLTVPLHRELRSGLLRAILRDASLSPDDLRDILRN